MNVSYSQLKMWKRCKRKWWYRYVQGLIPKQHQTRTTLGIYGHMLLQQHYLGNDVRLASNEYYQRLIADQPMELVPFFLEIKEQAENLFKRYLRHYKHQEWEVITAEREFITPIPNTDAYLKFVVDLMIQEKDGGLWLVDHKFTSRDLDSWENWLALDEQANLYLWGLNERGYNVKGAIFNLIRTKIPTVPRVLKSGQLSKAKNIDTDPETYLQAIIDNKLNVRDYTDILEYLNDSGKPFFRQFKTTRSKPELDLIGLELEALIDDLNANCEAYPVKNATQACGWDCPYLELCLMDSKLIDSKHYISVEFEHGKQNLDR